MEFDFAKTPDGMVTPEEALPQPVVDAVLKACARIATVLRGGEPEVKLEDLLAPDLIAFLQAGPFEEQAELLSHTVGSRKLQAYSWIPRAVRRTETGQLVVVEAKASSGIFLRGREMWWFTRKLRTGICPRCSAPFDRDPTKNTCPFCGEGLKERPWILVRVVDGVDGVGEGKANPSIRFAWFSETARRQIKGRVKRAAQAYLNALVTGDVEPLTRFADKAGLEQLQQLLAESAAARKVVEGHGGPAGVALKTEWIATEEYLESTMRMTVPVPYEANDVAFAPFVSQRWRWERTVPQACPQCGGKLPKEDAPEMCPYCGVVEGVGEWRISRAELAPIVDVPPVPVTTSTVSAFGATVTSTVTTTVTPLSELTPEAIAAIRELVPDLDLSKIPSADIAKKLGADALKAKAEIEAEAKAAAEKPEGPDTLPMF